jgi:hypothetical protein
VAHDSTSVTAFGCAEALNFSLAHFWLQLANLSMGPAVHVSTQGSKELQPASCAHVPMAPLHLVVIHDTALAVSASRRRAPPLLVKPLIIPLAMPRIMPIMAAKD